MKRIKLTVAIAAVILGIGGAYATKAEKSNAKFSTYIYARLADGTWIAPNPNMYECDASTEVCEGKFSYQNPPQNASPDQGVLVNDGTYTLK
jgi:Family of unknown function (DUF6520)